MKEKDFNTLYKELEQIVQLLESGELPLEEAVDTYTKGHEIVKILNEKLDKARSKLMLDSEGGLKDME